MNRDERYPAWVREMLTLLPACAHFVLAGNVRDLYFGPRVAPPPDDEPEIRVEKKLVDLPTIVGKALLERGFRLVLSFEINLGASVVTSTDPEINLCLGAPPEALAPPDKQLKGLQDLIEKVGNAQEPVALLVESASRLIRNPSSISDDEFKFFRAVDRMARSASPVEGTEFYNPIVWVTNSERDLPSWFTVGNEVLRNIVVPMPHSGERAKMAQVQLEILAENTTFEGELDRPVRLLSEQTAGLGLVAIESAVRIAGDQGLGPDRIDDAARSYRLGVVDNPWRADFVAERLREEFSDAPLSSERKRLGERVLGQRAAVDKALDILLRSAAGLTAAQAGPSASRPRGVLFFAGPTGVGKTELAKAITTLLFDDERFYARFDMSEYSAEQSAERLIGAPPGFVGYDAGGQLTNAMRERPFSVVLFDEIEKAHASILDKFLQVLDDGRLTDGRGETVYFTEAVIVFTSNLGIYREVREVTGGRESVRRELAISLDSHPDPTKRAEAIKDAIADYFTLQLGRPELLNRIGIDNIVVFDFIDKETAVKILDAMLTNISNRLEREHGLPLQLTQPTRQMLVDACLEKEVLAMGGRGIGSKLETALINPLSRLLTLTALGDRSTTVELVNSAGQWTASWK